MTTRILFVQGGGEGAHEEDARLAASLRRELGPSGDVRYPRMPNEDNLDYRTWTECIAAELAHLGDDAVVVAHSIGASVVIKWLTEAAPPRPLAGVFLIAAPFRHDHEVWRWKDIELPRDAAARLPSGLPLFLYHGSEDEIVPFAHLDLYQQAFPEAHVRRLEGRNHQLDDNLADVARAIRSLSRLNTRST